MIESLFNSKGQKGAPKNRLRNRLRICVSSYVSTSLPNTADNDCRVRQSVVSAVIRRSAFDPLLLLISPIGNRCGYSPFGFYCAPTPESTDCICLAWGAAAKSSFSSEDGDGPDRGHKGERPRLGLVRDIGLNRYIYLHVWRNKISSCNRRDKNKIFLPMQYCQLSVIYLTCDDFINKRVNPS